MIRHTLDLIGRQGPRALAIGVMLGLVAPPLADLFRPLLAPLLLPPLTLALVRLDWAGFRTHIRKPVKVALLLGWLLVVSPLLAAAILSQIPMEEDSRTAVILMACAPPIMSCPAFALLLGLDASLAVIGSVGATALVPLTLPVLALKLLDLDLEIGVAALMLRLGLVVGFAFIVSLGIRRLTTIDWRTRNASVLDGISVVALVLFAVAIMQGVTAIGFARPKFFFGTIVLAFAANLVLQAIGYGVARAAGRIEAATVALTTGNRNMGLVLVVLADRAAPDVAAYFALAQIPMYMLPALLNPLYRRIARRQ